MDAGLRSEDWLGRTVEVVFDRPLGTPHPKFPEILMEQNYGFVPGTLAPDGSEVDIYVLGPTTPLERCEARVIAVIRRRDDVEDKLVAVPPGAEGNWDEQAITEATAFQERWFDSYIEMAPALSAEAELG
ncbi:MAG: inorganic pyrophosphatase [Dehalococcoidia bacterium]|nr:inorganic pyrophosphatase [Dehalococcoidia bacterium]